MAFAKKKKMGKVMKAQKKKAATTKNVIAEPPVRILVKTSEVMEEDICCPRFEPRKYDEKEIVFDKKWFAKGHVTSVFHMPLNFGPVVTKMMERIKAAKMQSPDYLLLSDENSAFGSDLYVAVKANTPGLSCGTISGRFMTKVFEGPYSDTGKWIAEMKKYVNGKGKGVMRYLFYYTTCPKCAKKYGHNYVVIFAQVE